MPRESGKLEQRKVGPLERDHYDVIFHTLAVRNTARFSLGEISGVPGHVPIEGEFVVERIAALPLDSDSHTRCW